MVRYHLALLSVLLFGFYQSTAQSAADYAVQLTATVQSTPARITLTWKPLTDTPTYLIFRKAKADITWGSFIATLSANDSFFTDVNVAADTAYEYQVMAQGPTILSTGYIYAGISNPPMHNKGALLLLVDSTFTDSCSPGIYTLMQDISGDGWRVIRKDLSRSMPDTGIHTLITNCYNSNPDLLSVLILGHLAVPYSGDLNPDGHPNHMGAWPADIYYATITGPWTDSLVTNTSADFIANHNVPFDGKWDQTVSPLPALEISRIDFYNMPAFSKTEVQLMTSYLARDHRYKMDSIAINHRALISDNFGAFGGEAFAANGWRNFPPLLTRDSIAVIPFILSLNDSAYQWAYGCGGGTFTSADGIGITSDFTDNNMNVIFTMLFGSFFGDWNVQNNFLRAPLCSDVPALTSCWAGRPNWFFHHMALGENIGYATRLTQSNYASLYTPANYGAGFVHIALMGDLTLRTDYIKPPLNLVVTPTPGTGATLAWTASPDINVAGYYVYRSDTMFGFYRLISAMLPTTTFHDSMGVSGLKYYMVRPVKLQQTPSGSYYNLGIGITDTATVSYPDLRVANIKTITSLYLYPNPVKDFLNISITAQSSNATFDIINGAGQQLLSYRRSLQTGSNTVTLDVNRLPAGVYELVTHAGNDVRLNKWVKVQ